MQALLPAQVCDAAREALLPLGMTPEDMNFDRHWATGVKLADSTVVRCVQDVWALPHVADSIYFAAMDMASFQPLPGGMDSILTLMGGLRESYLTAIDSLTAADSLALLCSAMWFPEEAPEWGLIYSSRGAAVPLEEDSLDLDLDAFTDLLMKWSAVDDPEPALVIGLVLGLEFPDEYGTMTAPGVEGGVIDYRAGPGLTWVIGGSGRNVYTGSPRYDVIIDIGGDDLYLAGADGVGMLGNPVSLIADLGGNDTYISSSPVSQGSGFMGYGALIDLEGDDVYRGGAFSQGSAMMGGGLLADLGGNDFMEADVHSQGAATLGTAWLMDTGGDDVRRLSAYGQGFGGPGGRGTLVDSEGNDTYLAGFTYPHEPLLPRDNLAMAQGFGTGLRPFCAGGIGALIDLGTGNDTYRAEVFGQGSAYFYSLGVLLDEGGQDVFSSAQYAQGTGIHLASGILVNMGGDDQYTSRRGPAQGSAHDLSTGFLLDMEGEDSYATDGGQGLALTNSAAVFIDMAGSDLYAVRGFGQGESRWARGSAGSALFLDLADEDFYLGRGVDGESWAHEYSAGADLPGVTTPPAEEMLPVGSPESLDIDSLFIVASEWEVSGNRDRVLAHREEFAARGPLAVDFVLQNHLGSWSGLEHRAISAVLKENSGYAAPRMISMLEHELTDREMGNLITWLGEAGGEAARPPLEAMAAESLGTGITVALLGALGEIGNPESIPCIEHYAVSESERVRRQTAVTMGKMGPGAMDVLTVLSEDFSMAVRSAAEKALEALEEQQPAPARQGV
jgi:hypothetical protein